MNANEEPKIYLLPNLMTAGNLFCGFAAILRIIEAALVIQQGGSAVVLYHQALTFVLGAVSSTSSMVGPRLGGERKSLRSGV